MPNTIPTTASELEEVLNDDKALASLFDSSGKPKAEFGEFIRAYAAAQNKADPSIGQQIREETQSVLWNMARENGARPSRPDVTPMDVGGTTGGVRNRFYNSAAPGAAVEEVFANAAELFQAAYYGRERLSNSAELTTKYEKARGIQNAYGTTVPADGGLLVPETVRSDIMSLALESGLVRPRASIIPMTTPKTYIPMVDETSHVSSVFGGMVAYWEDEGDTHTDTQGKVGQAVLDVKKLTGSASVRNELISDAPAFMSFLSRVMPQAWAWHEDDAFINGDGAKQPLGFLNAPPMIDVAARVGQTTDTIVWENCVDMYSRMLPQSLERAVWICSPAAFPELATMSLSVGTGGGPIWITDGTGTPRMTILGRPVIVSEKIPTLGAAGGKDLLFVDLNFYLIGDLQSMTVSSSPHVKFTSDQTVFKIVGRVDGRPWLKNAITPANGGPTLSPFVSLAERV